MHPKPNAAGHIYAAGSVASGYRRYVESVCGVPNQHDNRGARLQAWRHATRLPVGLRPW